MPRDHSRVRGAVAVQPGVGVTATAVRATGRRRVLGTVAAWMYTLHQGCSGPQSALDPAGIGAERIAALYWWMAAGAAVVWLVVAGLAAYALARPHPHDRRRTAMFVIGGGVVFPTIVLTVLLSFGLRELPRLLAPAPEGSLTVEVRGLQWWWHVRYPESGVVLANEIRLPIGEPVQFILEADDVIHSFWIPALGGKMDMIPGRQTRLTLEPERPGVYRGACAELCGESHALMTFDVVLMERAAFQRWLENQAAPAPDPVERVAVRGQDLFLAAGCGACHTIRGTAADGVLGPDLTHVGGRLSLGGGHVSADPSGFRRWMERPAAIKPGAHMPAFEMFSSADLAAIAAYLDGLE